LPETERGGRFADAADDRQARADGTHGLRQLRSTAMCRKGIAVEISRARIVAQPCAESITSLAIVPDCIDASG
jgi:hypothetical protein